MLLLQVPLQGQVNSIDPPSINLDSKNMTLEQILQQLNTTSGYKFYFKSKDLPLNKFSKSFENAQIDAVMTALLAETSLGYMVYQERSIVVIPKSIAENSYTVAYYEARDEASKTKRSESNETIGKIENLAGDGIAVIQGKLTEEETNVPIIGATVIVQNIDVKTTSDLDGNFEIKVPAGVHYLNVSYVGFSDVYKSLRVLSSGTLKLSMEKGAVVLDEITVSARAADESVSGTQAGITKLDISDIKKTPTFMGETDVVKTLLLDTGVSSSGEGATGFNVRGGDVDQNLILQDNGILLNSSHSLGFFSYFNTDFIKEVELYKAIMPAQYGGRLSSVLDVKTKEGDFTKFRLRGGVGPITSRLSVEGPIVKDKVSFIFGGRASYANWILRRVENLRVKNSSLFFYDTNAKITAKIGKNNTLTLSGYGSEDEFIYNNEFGFNYTNYTAQMAFKSILSKKLFSNFSIAYNDYRSARFDFDDEVGTKLSNNVAFYDFKQAFTYSPTNKMELAFGISSILYGVDPGILAPLENSIATGSTVLSEQGLESAIYANLEYDITYRLGISAGLRYSDFRFLGPGQVNEYEDNSNPNINQVIGQTTYQSGDQIATYNNLEPRFSLRLRTSNTSSIKTGYSRTVQYINQIFNGDSPTPVSQWQLSNNFIQPTTSHNFSAGFFKNYRQNNWESNAEVFYRNIDNLFDYKDFARLTANPSIETEILYGIGESYGLELSVKKKKGVLNGALNYTYSRSQRQIEGINKGEFYASNFDKPHDLSFVFNYQPNRRNSLTLNFLYASGRPTTPPVGNYQTDSGLVVPVFSSRNAGRIPDYHRLDLSYTVGKGYKKDKKFGTSWTISLYNVYGRQNAYSIFFTEAPNQSVQANKLALLGTVFPSITFNFETL